MKLSDGERVILSVRSIFAALTLTKMELLVLSVRAVALSVLADTVHTFSAPYSLYLIEVNNKFTGTMYVGELFCQGHQCQFLDRRRPETDAKIQLFSYLL